MHIFRARSSNKQKINLPRTANRSVIRGARTTGKSGFRMRSPRIRNSKTRFTIFRSPELPQEKSPNYEKRKAFKRKVRNSIDYRDGKKSKMRIVDKKFSKGFAYRAFFYFSYGRTNLETQYCEIKEALPSLNGKFKVMIPTDFEKHYDSIFLEDESDLHILVLILGRSKITKIFKFE